VLGSDQVRAIAQKLGLSTDAAAGHLAEALPQVVDKVTPHGSLPDAGALSGLFEALRGQAR
jgi:uncharacterized protein YidB (DUF937 family)